MGPDLWFTKLNSSENGYKEAESRGTDDSSIPDTVSGLGQSAGERGLRRARDQGWEDRERGRTRDEQVQFRRLQPDPTGGTLVGPACRSGVQV